MSGLPEDPFAAGRCFLCGEKGRLTCSGCQGQVTACCSEHLALHKEEGNKECFPWKMVYREGVGRCMIASRNITAGEHIFRDKPVVIGPNQEGSPICLSCYSSIDVSYLCTSCGYPVCDLDCEKSQVHADECRILSRGPKPDFQQEETEAYHCILPLRLVLLSRSNPKRFSLTDNLMDHEEERCQTEDWKITERTVVKHILEQRTWQLYGTMQNVRRKVAKKDCKGSEIDGITVEEMRRAVGVLEVNSYEVHSFVSCGYRGCFPAASLLSHACVANSRHLWSTSPPYMNTCIAAVDIEKGTEILTRNDDRPINRKFYVAPTVCALLRRPKLKAGWYFECCCPRCSSATELGSEINTLMCSGCGLPELRPTEPKQLGGDFSCSNCKATVKESAAAEMVKQLLADIKQIAKSNNRFNSTKWLELNDKFDKLVHPQHEVKLELSKWLLPILCRGQGGVTTTANFPRDLVLKKLQLAKHVLAALDIVDAGLSRPRAKIMYEKVELETFLATDQLFEDANYRRKVTHIFSQSKISCTEKETDSAQQNGCIQTSDYDGNMRLTPELVNRIKSQCREILRIFKILGAAQTFEEIIISATRAMLERVTDLEAHILNNSLEENIEDYRSGWTLLELWKWSR